MSIGMTFYGLSTPPWRRVTCKINKEKVIGKYVIVEESWNNMPLAGDFSLEKIGYKEYKSPTRNEHVYTCIGEGMERVVNSHRKLKVSTFTCSEEDIEIIRKWFKSFGGEDRNFVVEH